MNEEKRDMATGIFGVIVLAFGTAFHIYRAISLAPDLVGMLLCSVFACITSALLGVIVFLLLDEYRSTRKERIERKIEKLKNKLNRKH